MRVFYTFSVENINLESFTFKKIKINVNQGKSYIIAKMNVSSFQKQTNMLIMRMNINEVDVKKNISSYQMEDNLWGWANQD